MTYNQESAEKWSLNPCGNSRDRVSGVISCKSFFPFFLWLVASLFADSERDLLLTVYGTPLVPFGVLKFLFQGS
jgi:hypothetical protein